MSHRNFRWPEAPAGLYRDPARGKLAGVCAGLGAYYQIKPGMLRALLIVGSACGLFIPLIGGYVLLTMILQPFSERTAQGGFAYRPTSASPGTVRRRFEDIDRRLGRIEGWVTSEDYQLRQKFKDL